MQIIRNMLYYSIIVGGLLFWFFVMVNFIAPDHRIVVYNCELAEISPDYPMQVKEDCRKLRSVSTQPKITHKI